MKILNIQQAKTHLSRLVEEAVRGADVIISKAGKPLVKLVPVGVSIGPRPLGILSGRVSEAPDCWDPDTEFAGLFYGSGDSAALRVAGTLPKP